MAEKLKLPNVTLIAVAGNKQGETIASMYKSMKQVDFASVKLLTNIDISCTGIEVVNVGGLDTWQEYNRFIVKELYKYFDTEFCLIVQYDSWVLEASCWQKEFLDYDVVAAKWLDIGKPYNVGNGGFTIRSKKIQTILGTDENIITTCPEDVAICKVYGQYLIDTYGIKFATEEVADKFAFELNEPLHPTFGFHSWHWKPYKKTVVIKRDYALGDVLSVEPLLEYYHKKGYKVSLDTGDYFMDFFGKHYFPIVPKRHLNPKLPYEEINLNSTYEVKPKQLHLESYYDFACVPKEERIIRNTKLTLQFDPKYKDNKLFKKYAVIHIDERNEPHRNIYGVNWGQVVNKLNELGYIVVQVGVGKHEEIKGAIKMATPTAPFLMWVVGSSDLFLGTDSGVSHVASGFNIPSIILSGSVNIEYIHPDMSNKIWIHNHHKKVCDTPFCWHEVIGQAGQDCYINKDAPPCVQFKTIQVLEAIDKIIKTAK